MIKKELLPILIVLPLFAVNAQTFQRRPQQPAFFMPKSVITSQQPERLPSVDSMNYQGQRISNEASSPFIGVPEAVDEVENAEENSNTAIGNTLPVEAKTVPEVAIAEPKIIEKTAETKTEKAIKIPGPQQIAPEKIAQEKAYTPEKSGEKPEIVTQKQDSDNYQEIFAQILDSHREDLNKISQGQTVNNPEIEKLVDSYTPKIHRITDTVDVRKIKL